jgi:hypothetical protein
MNRSYTSTGNLKAASALATLGFDFHESTPCVRIAREDGKESSAYWVAEDGPRGMRASKVIHWMTKGHAELEESDAEHPVNYIRAGFINRERLIDLHHDTTRTIEIRRNGKILLLSENATQETRQKFAKFF